MNRPKKARGTGAGDRITCTGQVACSEPPKRWVSRKAERAGGAPRGCAAYKTKMAASAKRALLMMTRASKAREKAHLRRQRGDLSDCWQQRVQTIPRCNAR